VRQYPHETVCQISFDSDKPVLAMAYLGGVALSLSPYCPNFQELKQSKKSCHLRRQSLRQSFEKKAEFILAKFTAKILSKTPATLMRTVGVFTSFAMQRLLIFKCQIPKVSKDEYSPCRCGGCFWWDFCWKLCQYKLCHFLKALSEGLPSDI
jgi:hypothetical protein